MKFILHSKKQEETFFTDPKGPVCPTLGSKKYSVNPENNLVRKNVDKWKKMATKRGKNVKIRSMGQKMEKGEQKRFAAVNVSPKNVRSLFRALLCSPLRHSVEESGSRLLPLLLRLRLRLCFLLRLRLFLCRKGGHLLKKK